VSHQPLARRAGAEALGTGLLVVVVVGSGIAAQRLSPTDVGLQLLENSTATALGLAVLILLLAPVSGAHLNPAITLVLAVLDHETPANGRRTEVLAYVGAQLVGGLGGAVLANLMFELPAVQVSTADRASAGHLLGEVVATAGLVLVVLGLLRTGREQLAAPTVAAYIGAAYWFTSSTSFANPAVTAGRVLTDTFAGIAPTSAAAFVLAQLAGASVGAALAVGLFPALRLQPSATITSENAPR